MAPCGTCVSAWSPETVFVWMALGAVMSAGDPQPTVTNAAARSVIVVVCFMNLISKQGWARQTSQA